MRRALLVSALIALVIAFFPTAAGGQDTGQVTLVHAATYDAETDFPVTVCVDDEVLIEEFNTTEIEGPLDLPAGTYNVAVIPGVDEDCASKTTLFLALEVAAGDNITVMAYWGPEGPDLAVLDNDTSCVDPGNGRVTARHAAAAGPVNVTVGGAAVITGLAPGSQATLDVPAGAYPDVAVVEDGSGDLILSLGTITVVANEELVAYVYGGADGEVGAFTDTVALEPCEEPVESTTTASTAAGAATRPTFTG